MVTEDQFKKMLENMGDEEKEETLKLSGLTLAEAKESKLETSFPVLLKQNFPSVYLPIIEGMEKEYVFDANRKWKLDFAWVNIPMIPFSVNIAVELHGIYGKDGSSGRHIRPIGFTNDREKMNNAALQGWIVLEVVPSQLDSNVCFLWLLEAFEKRGISYRKLESIHKQLETYL